MKQFIIGLLLGLLLTAILAGAAQISRITCDCTGNAFGMCEPIIGGFSCTCRVR